MAVRVETDTEIRHGDLMTGQTLFARVLCDGFGNCPARQERDEFEALLERIRQGNHPEYGALSWDGQRRQMEITVTFDSDGASEEVVRRRALRYLESLSPEERALMTVEVVFREGSPRRATLRAQTGTLPGWRLDELRQKAGIK